MEYEEFHQQQTIVLQRQAQQLREVSKEAFFQSVGPRDVHPSVEGSSKGEHGIYSVFKTRAGVEVGRIYSKPLKQYLLK